MTQRKNGDEAVTVPPVEVRYKGVRKSPSGKYGAKIRDRRQRKEVWLGSYATTTEAARIYDAAVTLLRGETAITNFPQVTENYLQRAKIILEKHNVFENVNNNNNNNNILPNLTNVDGAPPTPGGNVVRFPMSNWHPPQFRDKYHLEVLKRDGVIIQNSISIQREIHMELNLELTLAQPRSI